MVRFGYLVQSALALLILLPTTAYGLNTRSARLPGNAVPSRYQLYIEPDLKNASFAGRASIVIKVVKPLDDITLNAKELNITNAAIEVSDHRLITSKVLPLKVHINDKLEQAHIFLPQKIQPGIYTLKLSFKGVLNDKLRGFYRGHYNDSHGVRHTIATTQMEPTDARRMFPCFDEPVYKATYQITAAIDPDLVAISNAPIVSEKVNNASHKKEVVFADTPRMSTYLVALIVGKFEATETKTIAGIPIRIWSVPGKIHLGAYAQEIAARLLPWYNNYFGIPYPGKKLDLIAIPDFEAGAMENLGAITFRETLLLVDEKLASKETKQHSAGVIAHEMAHMWFGDLVTMSWWDDLWLNEAFATWMATRSIDKLMPEWHAWDEFALGRAMTLGSDALHSTRPIHFKVDNPQQANEMFDEITYTKGASILRMLEKYVGEETFRKGVHDYLAKHSWSNARTEDLWSAIGKASGLAIPAMMKGWVYQPGYPLIKVDLSANKLDLNQLSFSQTRFFLDPPQPESNLLWQVPILVARPGSVSKNPPFLLKQKIQSVISGAPGAGSVQLPVCANAGANGYYRVNYSSNLLKRLNPIIESNLTPCERLGLLSDQWALAVSGLASLNSYLDLTANYKEDLDPTVVNALISHLDAISHMINPESRPNFQKLVGKRLDWTWDQLGWTAKPNDTYQMKQLRAGVVRALGTIGQNAKVISEARTLFSNYLQSPDSIDPDLIGPITRIVAYNGDEEDFRKIKQCWLDATTPEVEERNLLSLATFRKPELINKTLAMCLGNEVRSQDAPHLLMILLNNDNAKYETWKFIKQNWTTILKRYPLNLIPRVISSANSFNTTTDEDDLKKFFQSHPVPAGQRAVAKVLERVHIQVAFRNRSLKDLNQWLSRSF